jgi:hypothetical protein
MGQVWIGIYANEGLCYTDTDQHAIRPAVFSVDWDL